MQKYAKRVLKTCAWGIGVLFLIQVMLVLLLHIPVVQKTVVQFAIGELKSRLGTEVSIESIHLKPLQISLELEQIYVGDRSQDTLFYAKEFSANLSLGSLLHGSVGVNKILLQDFFVNLYQTSENGDYNYQFLIDSFASSDTTHTDQTPSSFKASVSSLQLKDGRFHLVSFSNDSLLTDHQFNASNILLSAIDADISCPVLSAEKIEGAVRHLSFIEQSGLELKNLTLKAKYESDLFKIDELFLSMPQSQLQIPEMWFDMRTQKFACFVDKSYVIPTDIVAFAPVLSQMQDSISLSLAISGQLPSISVDKLHVGYGHDIMLQASAVLSDYLHYHSSELSAQVWQFKITPQGVHSILRLTDATSSLPEVIKEMGDIRLKGNMAGSLEHLNLRAEAWARAGSLQARANMNTDSTFSTMRLVADVSTLHLQLQKLGLEGLGKMSALAKVEYRQESPNEISISSEGVVRSLQYQNDTLENIYYTVAYSPDKLQADVQANMPQGDISLSVESHGSTNAKYVLEGKIRELNINTFFSYPQWKHPLLWADFQGEIYSGEQSGYGGSIRIEGLKLQDQHKLFQPGTVLLTAENTALDNGYIALTSSLLDARIEGRLLPEKMMEDISYIAHRYLPQFIPVASSKAKGVNKFNFSFQTKNILPLMDILNIPLTQRQPVTLKGEMNAEERKLLLNLHAPALKYGEGIWRGSRLHLSTTHDKLYLEAATMLFEGDNRRELEVMANAVSDTIRIQLNCGNDAPELSVGGQIDSYISFRRNKEEQLVSELMIEPSMIYVNDLRFLLSPAFVVHENNRTVVSNLGFRLEGEEYVKIYGAVSDQPSDTLHIAFSDAQLLPVLTALNITDIDGLMQGDIRITSVTSTPRLLTDGFLVDKIVIKQDTLGTLRLASRWIDSKQAAQINAGLEKLNQNIANIQGFVYTSDTLKTDLHIHLNRFNIGPLQSFSGGMFTRLQGYLSTDIHLQGPLKDPDIEGWLGLEDGLLGLDYTNVEYHIADTIQINKNQLGFDNLQIRDSRGNKASLSARVEHQNFSNMQYSLRASLNNFMALNTQNRIDSLYYGRVDVSGEMEINGDSDGVDVKMNVKNANRSQFTVLIPQSETAVEYQGIVYVNTPEPEPDSLDFALPQVKKDIKSNPFNVTVRGVAHVNDNLQLNIIMPQITGSTSLQVAGRGQIEFDYNDRSEITKAQGNYEITGGTVKLDLKQISGITFNIQEGSKLMFRGDVMQTTFDISAYRQIKADLSSLDASFSNDRNLTSTRTDVQCVLGLQGNMDQMTLTYNIVLPNASDDVRRKVQSLIVTEEQRIQQFVYLLFTGSFYSGSSSSVDANIGVNSVMTSVASGALSTALNTAFSRILGDKWDIGTDFSTNDGNMSSMNVNVNVSTRLFDDRLQVKTNLGYRSGSELSGTDDGLVGDIDVEYHLTNSLKVKVYNRENDKYYRTATTTQGVGIVYTRESKKLKGLFRFLRKRKKAAPDTIIPDKTLSTPKEEL